MENIPIQMRYGEDSYPIGRLNRPRALDVEQNRDRRPDFDFWWSVDTPTAFDEDRLIEISTDTDPGALMQVVRVWDQDLAVEISPELIFAATTRRMGPVED